MTDGVADIPEQPGERITGYRHRLSITKKRLKGMGLEGEHRGPEYDPDDRADDPEDDA